MLGPVLQGEIVSLKPPRVEDMATYLAWHESSDVTQFLWGFPGVSSLAQQLEWLERVARAENEVVWRIALDDRTVGRTSIFGIDWINRRAETSIVIGEPSLWGKGLGSEIVRLRCHYAFDELGLERLETISLVNNIGMHRALERSGYQNLTRLHRFVYRHGEWHDVYLFELLRPVSHACDFLSGGRVDMEGSPTLTLTLLPETYAVCRLDPQAPVPEWALDGNFSSVTRSADELSIVCSQRTVPEGVVCNGGWRCFEIEGPLDFSLTGVIAALSMPLADARISLFVVATYKTDYLLVPEARTADAKRIWAEQGHGIRD